MGTPAKPGKFQLQCRIMAMRSNHICLLVFTSWCTISGSVQKTVQCTVFSDRSPRGECKPHRGAARARPVGDGAPPTSLSAAHNAKKTRKRNRSQVFHLGAPSAGAFKKQCSALFLATGPREANARRIAAQSKPGLYCEITKQRL